MWKFVVFLCFYYLQEVTSILILVELSAEGAALSETGTTTSGLAQDGGAGRAENDSLSMAEDSGNVEAARALNVHEVGVRRLHKSLQLVLSFFRIKGRVKKINSQLVGGIYGSVNRVLIVQWNSILWRL